MGLKASTEPQRSTERMFGHRMFMSSRKRTRFVARVVCLSLIACFGCPWLIS